jgi:hypothetical protein
VRNVALPLLGLGADLLRSKAGADQSRFPPSASLAKNETMHLSDPIVVVNMAVSDGIDQQAALSEDEAEEQHEPDASASEPRGRSSEDPTTTEVRPEAPRHGAMALWACGCAGQDSACFRISQRDCP